MAPPHFMAFKLHCCMYISLSKTTQTRACRPVTYPGLSYTVSPPSAAIATVKQCRGEIAQVLHGVDDRLVVIVGPCSVHDVKAAMEYGMSTFASAFCKNFLLRLFSVTIVGV